MTSSGLVEAIHRLEDHFEALALRRSYGGALAYNYYGPPRFTQDVDVLALVPDTRVPALVERLVTHGGLRDTVPFRALDLPSVLADLRGPQRFTTFLLDGIPVELFTPWHPFHHRVLERSPERDLEGRRIRIHSPEDLIVIKKVFDRPKDLMDIRAVLLAQKGALDLVRIRQEAKVLLTDESWRELDRLIVESS